MLLKLLKILKSFDYIKITEVIKYVYYAQYVFVFVKWIYNFFKKKKAATAQPQIIIHKPITYFTSDTHYWHFNIIKYCNRPFVTASEMNEVLIANYNKLVKPNDIVVFLGDIALSGCERTKEIVKRLNGYKIAFIGNHDRTINFLKASGFDEVYKGYGDWEYQGKRFRLAHYPFGTYSKKCPPEENCDWLLCGHVHEKWKIKGNMINIGVDVWEYHPVSIENILNLIKSIESR